MRAVVLLALAVALVAARPKWHELSGYSFDQYVVDFQKPHKAGTDEYARRKALFDAELKIVQTFNAAKRSWKKGVNHYSDWTADEKRALRGNKVGMKRRTKSTPELAYTRSAGPLPRFVDYRNTQPPVLTGVKDQGMCGSCWAHAATEQIESHAALATGELFVLSQQQITACTPDPQQCGGTGGCAGAIAELAFDYVKTVGIQQEWVDPYTAYFGTTGNCSAVKYPVVNVSGYTAVAHNDADAMADALARVGPLAVSVDAQDWSNYETGVYEGCDYANNITMDHAVQAVGFGHDFDQGKDYWIIRNSWSPAWGELGYIRLLRQPGNTQCGWNVNPGDGDGCKGQTAPEWACGMCGVAYDTLYPNTAKFHRH